MRATVIDCAGCGAPLGGAVMALSPGALVPCLYCGALLRFDALEKPLVVERQLTAELIQRAREAALRGGRLDAIELCVREGIEHTAAAAVVDDVIKSVGSRAVFGQALNPIGWTLVFGSAALVLGGVAVLAWPSEARLVGLAFVLFGALNLAFLSRGVATSLRFIVASRGTALIQRSVCVGPTGFSDGCLVYSLSVDVAPRAGGAPFHARLVLPVRPLSVGKVEVGRTIAVRFRDEGAWLRPDTA